MSRNLVFLFLQLTALCALSDGSPCCPQRQEMCSSLEDLKTQVLSPDDTSGSCTTSNDCTQVSCDLIVVRSGFDVPFFLNVTLLPCSTPYAVYVDISSSLLGPIVSGTFTDSARFNVVLGGMAAVVAITIHQQCDGLILWVEITSSTSRIDFVTQANVSMHCLECPTKEDLHSSTEDVKTTVLSPNDTSGTCEVSSDFTQLVCDLIVVRSGVDVPFFLNITLLPCSTPYAVYVDLSSSLLGPIVNGIFTETTNFEMVLGGMNAVTSVRVTQQCNGVILAIDIVSMNSRIDFVLPTGISMYCMNRTKTCEVDGKTYELGEDIPNEDPCKTCECTKSGQVCDTIACDIPLCEHGLQPVTKEGECCPECACVENGTHYCIGSTIPTGDPCTSCECTEDGKLCLAVTCLGLVCENGLTPVRKEGECCHECGCVVNGTSYCIGDSIPTSDPCITCECTESGEVCIAQSCSLIDCPPFTETVDTRVEGECCPNRTCVPKCPSPCTRKLCKSAGNPLCSLPGSSPCLNMTCNVTTCKACYYTEGPPHSLPTGCEKYNCARVKDDANRFNKCLKRFGRCIGKQNQMQYGKPSRDIIRPRNFKCYGHPC